MHAYIKETFWSDSRVEHLSPEEKLSLLWLFTNSQRDILGFVQVTRRRFEFETGTKFENLQSACQALPESFQALPDDIYFCVNFIRHQLGNGKRFSLTNNIVKGIVRAAKMLSEALGRAFFNAYPEIENLIKNPPPLPKGLQSPSEGMARGKGKGKVKDILEEGSGEKPETAPVDPVSIVGIYPKREGQKPALEALMQSISNGEDTTTIIAGTRAIAAVIAQMPGGHLNTYVCSAERFFREEKWRDDPAAWLGRVPPKKATATGSTDMGGRKTPEAIIV